MKYKCHGCGEEKESDKIVKEFCCINCGAVNVVILNPEGYENACDCIAPKGFEWSMPSGELEGPKGKIFVSAQGTTMTKEEWINAYGVDPEITRAWMKRMGIEGREGFANLSNLKKVWK